MGIISNNIGIYTDAIEDVIETCEDFVSEATELINQYGTEKEQMTCNRFDLAETALDIMNNNFDVYNMSNSIISAYYFAVEDLVNECKTLSNLDIKAEHYTNCHDSHLYVCHENVSIEYYDGELKKTVAEAIIDNYADKLHDQIQGYLKETGKEDREYPVEWIKEDLINNEVDYTIQDVINSVETGKLSPEIKNTVNQYAEMVLKDKSKTSIDLE